jgi:AcrR family transcriptional regulator
VTPARRRSSAQTREHVLGVARELFYWRGIHPVGVDTLAADAGVAPATLYRIFGSKDGLVGAYVDREAQSHRDWFERSLGAATRPVGERIIDLFAALGDLLRPEVCRGCPFQMTLAELPDVTHPAHRSAVELKRWVRGRFASLAAQHAGQRADGDTAVMSLADHLILIYEGAFGAAQSFGGDGLRPGLVPIVEHILR